MTQDRLRLVLNIHYDSVSRLSNKTPCSLFSALAMSPHSPFSLRTLQSTNYCTAPSPPTAIHAILVPLSEISTAMDHARPAELRLLRRAEDIIFDEVPTEWAPWVHA